MSEAPKTIKRYLAGWVAERSQEALADCLKFIADTEEFRSWDSLTTPEWFVQAALLEMKLGRIIAEMDKSE